MITSMIFFPTKTYDEMPTDHGLSHEQVSVQTEDGLRLAGWFLQAQGEERGVLYFLHGNAGNISNRLFKAAGWVRRGFSVFLLDYRGYGESAGTIAHGEDLIRDARAGLLWLQTEKKTVAKHLVFYGESIGTHPVIRLAIQEKPAAVILEAPFTSFTDLAKKHYPMIPQMMIEPLMKDFAFNNSRIIPEVSSPLMIIHGTKDSICPLPMAEELFKKAQEPKELFLIEQGDHNDLPMAGGELFWEKPSQFVRSFLI